MSLQVWLPMTKDLRQQGLSDVEVINSGATYSSTGGKLGGCYSFDGTDDYLSFTLNNVINSNNSFSICVWVNLVGNNSYNPIFFFGTTTPNGNGTSGISLHGPFCNRLEGSDGTHTIDKTFATDVTINVWNHVIVTYDGLELKYYCNGILKGSISWNYGFGNQSNMKIGDFWGPNFKGKMNDFRIYDHALSPMEVKELSKGLVLHYPLNREGWGQENLLLNSNDLTLWPIESSGKIELQEDGYFKVSSKASNTTRYGIYYDFTFPEPNTYTFSVDVRDDWLIGVAPASTFTWTTANLSGTQGKKRISYTCTSTEEKNKCRIYIAGTGTGGRVTYLKQPKLEKGSIATPWCPNSSDTLATTMGLNSATEYDCSGFCNNGTYSALPTVTSDTPKYNVSSLFGAYNTPNLITNTASTLCPALSNCTIAWWQKSNGAATLLLTGQTASYYVAASNANTYYHQNAGSPTMYRDGVAGTYQNTTGVWHHYVLTGVNLSTWTTLKVNSYRSGWPVNGYISDLRIYATALSADDVKSLYQNSAYISSNATTYAHEFVEE